MSVQRIFQTKRHPQASCPAGALKRYLGSGDPEKDLCGRQMLRSTKALSSPGVFTSTIRSTSLPPLSATIVGMCCTAYFATTCGVAGGEDGAFGVDSRELREEGLGAAAVGAPARADGENHGLVGCNHGFDVGVVDHHDVVHENFSFKRTGAFGAAGSPASGMPSFDLLDTSYHVPSSNCKCFLLA